MLVYRCEDLIPIGYTNSDFQSDIDFRKSTLGCVFTLGGGAITWRSVKQSCIVDSTMEAEYVAACEAATENVNFHALFISFLQLHTHKVCIILLIFLFQILFCV